MIITCPSCTTNYDIDPSGIGAKGRQVKCASCQTFWHVEPEQETLAVANGGAVSVPETPAIDAEIPLVDESRLDDAFAALEGEDATSAEDDEQSPQDAVLEQDTAPEEDAPAEDDDDDDDDDEDKPDPNLSHQDLLDEIEGLPSPKEERALAKKRAKKEAKAKKEEEAEALEQAERTAAEQEEGVIDVSDEELEEQQAEAKAEKKREHKANEAKTQRKARMKRIAKRNRALASSMPAARVRRLLSIGSVTSLAALILTIVLFQQPIVRILPDLAGLYRLVGIDVNVLGLEFGDIKSERRHDNGNVSLVVTGHVKNVTDKPIELPKVLVSLQTVSQEEVYAWSIDPSVAYLDIGETIEFETQLSAPPAIADNVKLSFLSKGG